MDIQIGLNCDSELACNLTSWVVCIVVVGGIVSFFVYLAIEYRGEKAKEDDRVAQLNQQSQAQRNKL